MNHDPDNTPSDDIPELIHDLEWSLNAPSPEAMHAALAERQAARKRTLSVAGAFIAAIAVTGGLLALNNADQTSTVEVANEVPANAIQIPEGAEASDADDAGSVPEGYVRTTTTIWNGEPIANDSPPYEFAPAEIVEVMNSTGTYTALVETTENESPPGVQFQQIPADATGNVAGPNAEVAGSVDVVRISDRCRHVNYLIEWLGDEPLFEVLGEIQLLDDPGVRLCLRDGQPLEQFIFPGALLEASRPEENLVMLKRVDEPVALLLVPNEADEPVD